MKDMLRMLKHEDNDNTNNSLHFAVRISVFTNTAGVVVQNNMTMQE